MNISVVKRCDHPSLCWVEIAAFDSVGPGGQAALDVETKRLEEEQEFEGKLVN